MRDVPEGGFRLLCVGVGGQGVVTASRIVGEAGMRAGLEVAVGQLHGMSQRGGSVEATVVMVPHGRIPSGFIGAGDADAVLAFEPLEGVRARTRMSRLTHAVVNREPITPFSLTHQGEHYPDVDGLLASIQACCGTLVACDGAAFARALGSPRGLNIAMLGILASLGQLPFSQAALWESIEAHAPAAGRPVNRRAYDLGLEMTTK